MYTWQHIDIGKVRFFSNISVYGLLKECEKFIEANFSTDIVVPILQLAQFYENISLQGMVVRYLSQNKAAYDTIKDDEDFLELSPEIRNEVDMVCNGIDYSGSLKYLRLNHYDKISLHYNSDNYIFEVLDENDPMYDDNAQYIDGGFEHDYYDF